MASNQDELISEICGITGAAPATARQILEAADWNPEEAVRLFYESQEVEDAPDMDEVESSRQAGGSGAAGLSQGSRASDTSRTSATQSRMRTLKDLQSESAGDDSDDEDEAKQDFFAGGEKSGLAVQNPNRDNPSDHFNNIINQARQNRPRPGDEDQPARSTNFSGRAQTLGGDDAESQVVETTNASTQPTSLPRVTRSLHLWQDGFSVDDGPLYRFDDPANAPTLALINQGRAPLALLGVEPGQEVDLHLNPHKDEKYVQPKKKYKPFEGSGQRLGSPTPGPAAITAQRSAAAAAGTATSSGSEASTPSVSIDESQPTIQLQIRLGDGTQLRSRFNTSHTVGDVYEFVNASSTQSRSRAYALMTTFPSKELSDKAAKLGDLAEYKRGGVVVQKWT